MKAKTAVILSVTGMLLVSFPLMPRFFIWVRGDKPDLVYWAWHKAEKSWGQADYLKAIGENLKALWTTTDYEARVVISRLYYRRSENLEKQGQLQEAIDVCMSGARIIEKYDREGVFMYGCDELNMKYDLLSSESPVQVVTPVIAP